MKTKKQTRTRYTSPAESLVAHCPKNVTPGECWLWNRAKTPRGYGVLTHKNKSYYVHRVSYELHNGPIPDGLDVLHSCDNPACFNPDHLWVGTAKDNALDMVKKGRCCPTPQQGESHPNAKLAAEDVIEIRRLAESGMNQNVIANSFGVSQSAVMAIRTRRTWKHI